MMMDKPLPDWRPTGWRGTRVIEHSLDLPGGGMACCQRNKDGITWNWWTGRYLGKEATELRKTRTILRAKLCAEAQLRRCTRASLRKLERRS